MYKQVKTNKIATLENGAKINPVATLASEFGDRCQIARDDNCYILFLKQKGRRYRMTAWIFPEAFEVLKTLPSLMTSP